MTIKEGALVKAWGDDPSDYVIGRYDNRHGSRLIALHSIRFDDCLFETYRNAIEIPPDLAKALKELGTIRVLSENTPIARKEHSCDASEFILNRGINGYGHSFAELRTIAKAKKNNWKILKGQRYVRQNNICDGEFCTFKAIPEIDQICIDHDLYDC